MIKQVSAIALTTLVEEIRGVAICRPLLTVLTEKIVVIAWLLLLLMLLLLVEQYTI